MGWLSKTFKMVKGVVKDIGKLHEKVFKGVFVDPIKKAWKSKPLRYAMIGAAALAGGAMLAPMLGAGGMGAGASMAAGYNAAGLGLTGTLGSATAASAIPGMGGATFGALGSALTGGGAGMSLGQAAALQLGGGLLSGGAQALEGRRQEKMLERERDNRTVAGVRYQGGTAEDRVSAGDPLAGLEIPPARQPQGQQSGGMLSHAIMPSREERVPYYLRGQTA
jgi:hypothetical protein